MLLQESGGLVKLITRDVDLVDANPLRMGYPLRGEGLEVFDGVVGGEGQEGPDQMQAFVVGEMCGRSLSQGFTVEILASRSTALASYSIRTDHSQ